MVTKYNFFVGGGGDKAAAVPPQLFNLKPKIIGQDNLYRVLFYIKPI